MSQCPFCGSSDIEKPMFGGKELEGAPSPGILQLRKYQKCRACNKFFEPPLPKPVAAILILILMAVSVGVTIGGLSSGYIGLPIGGVVLFIICIFAIKRYFFTKGSLSR